MQNIKEYWQNMSEKTKKIIMAIIAGTAVIAVIAILALSFGRNKDYSVLFTGLSQEEAQTIAGVLQDDGVDYKYNAGDGTIRVPASIVDDTKAKLLMSGYPKSGFTYGMYLDNTGLMTTESDKQRIELYELQDRIGATIRSFEGVQDAKVTIAEASEQKYVLQESVQEDASASVVITMQPGSVLTEDKAQAVRNLISHAVKGMNFSEVTVYDGSTMLQVGGSSSGGSTGSDLTSLTSLVESNIAANVKVVLEKLYGTGNVAVSVKGTLNMQKLISESTQYSTPEKVDETDKTGLLEMEDLVNEDSQAGVYGAGGLVGSDANADTPRYTNDDGNEEDTDSYSSGSASREWLYNVLKEQRQVDPGVLEDTSIGVVIITDDNRNVGDQELLRLVANSAGIPVEDAANKISIVRAPEEEVETPVTTGEDTPGGVIISMIPLPILIAIGAALLLLLLLIIFLLLRRRRKKKNEISDEDFIGGDELSASELGLEGEGLIEGETSTTPILPEDEELNQSEEIMNLRMQRSMRLKQNIGEFVDQNPQIAAKLVQSWLRGEEGEDGSARNNTHGRKHSR
ncbi:MAG: flagellar M-ring protein FliF [Lachnospiraceae bacterium]|nr:flagellar M-ring protein FliF [Lachnospiraceae bacterium]